VPTITVVCPGCKIPYHVQPSLLGKPMRCQGVLCRRVFIVREGDGGPVTPFPQINSPADKSSSQQIGSVGEMVPLLPGDAAGAPEPPKEASWSDAPPVRRGPKTPPANSSPKPPAEKKPPEHSESVALPPGITNATPKPTPKPPKAAPEPPKKKVDGPRVVGPGNWEAPPVRRDKGAKPEPLPPADKAPAKIPNEPVKPAPPVRKPTYRPRTHWVKWGVISLCVLVGLVLGLGAYAVLVSRQLNEDTLAAEAAAEYGKENFAAASERYGQLIVNFPSSDHLADYETLRELSNLRKMDRTEGEAGLTAFATFADKARDNPVAGQRAAELGQAFVHFATGCADFATDNIADSARRPLLEKIRSAVPRVANLKGAMNDSDRKKIADAIKQAEQVFADADDLEKQIKAVAEVPTAKQGWSALQEVRNLIRAASVRHPGFAGKPEVVAVRQQLETGHPTSIRYIPGPGQTTGPRLPAESESSLLVVPPAVEPVPTAAASDPIVLALARGVLYALSASNGQVRWAVRNGIDTTTLPVRVPASGDFPETILVLSSDTATLTALDTNGSPLWRHHLGTPSLGRPLIVDQRAYLSTFAGEIHEIELAGGQLLGRYLLGQSLTRGGTHDPHPDRDRAYFPADDHCIYVLDLKNHKCESVIYSEHPAGSLRSELLLVSNDPVAPDSGYLILNQSQGLHATRLRAFELLRGPKAVEQPLKAGVDGWTWFPPQVDPERLIAISDTGMLGVYGVKQALGPGPALWSLVPQTGEGPDRGSDVLKRILPTIRPESGEHVSRSDVVQMESDDLWVLAGELLMRLRLGWTAKYGPRLVPAWNEPLELGSPVHASQSGIDPQTGRRTLYLVTQPANQQVYWATAVDEQTGAVRWKRQLGLVCEGTPVALTVPGEEPLLIAADRSGALFAIDPERFPAPKSPMPWQNLSHNALIGAALDDNPSLTPTLLPTSDGKSVYEVACSGKGKDLKLVIRQVTTIPGRKVVIHEKRVPISTTPVGPVALVGKRIVLPVVERQGDTGSFLFSVTVDPWPATAASIEEGLCLRARLAGTDTPSYVLDLGGDRYLTTDGQRGLFCWRWPANDSAEAVPAGRGERPNFAFRDRIAAAPVLVSNAGGVARVAVADAVGVLHLLSLGANGIPREERTWDLHGRITEAFVQTVMGTTRIGCVVDETQLVWLDPASDKELWRHHAERDTLVGRPTPIVDALVVAHTSGHFVLLDPKTGHWKGMGHRLSGTVVPVATPVPFGADRLLAPLSDGTLLMLSRQRLERRRPEP
jgi:PQQ-like domain